MYKLTLFAVFILVFVSQAMADELSEGYKSFINNDLTKAYAHFTAASQVPESRSDAFLMLAIMSTVDKEPSESFRYFLDFYKSSKESNPYISALFRQNCVLGYMNMKTEAQVSWMLDLLKRTDLNPGLKAHIYEALGKHYETIYDLKKSRDYFSRIGAVMNWQIVGDFENISASGFEKEYGPESHPEPGSVFKNKINADIKWFDLYKQVDGKWIDFTYNFNCTNTLVYAQTFCKSSSDMTAYLRIGTSGSLKLYVNDQLLYSEKKERNNGIDTYIIPVKISSGNNRILLKIGNSKLEQCNFMMRATDIDGNNLTNLQFSSKFEPYSRIVQPVPVPLVPFAESALERRIKENPEKLVNYIVLATAYLSNDKIDAASEILNKALDKAPNCSYLLNQLLELYVRDQNRTLSSLTREKIKSIDPDNPDILSYMINDAINSKNYKDARQSIGKKEKLYGKSLGLFYNKLSLASEENKAEEYSAILDEGLAAYPNDYTIVEDKFNFEKNFKKNQKAAIAVLKNFTRKYFHASAMKTLSDEYFQSGQVGDGINLLKQLIEYKPFDDSYYKYLGLYYLNAGKYNEAKQYLEVCLKIAPYYGPYYANFAKVFEEEKDNENAVKEYLSGIIYNPSDYDAINKLRNLQAKKDVFSYFPTTDYYKIFESSPTASDYPSDNFISLLEERQVVLHEYGGSESRVILMLKALTAKGIDYLKEYKISYLSNEEMTIEKAEVLKKNGNRLQAEVNDNQVVYTSLEPGDGVFLIYRRSKTVSGLMSKNFYEKWLLSSWYPSLDLEYKLLIDKNLKLNYKLDNSDVKPEISDADEFKLYSWKSSTLKAMPIESYMPPMVDAGVLLNISTLPDWDYVSKWYFDISHTKTEPDKTVTETVNNLLSGKQGLSQMEKARTLYNFIVQNIRYSSVSFRQSGTVPKEASEVLNTRIGDCKDLSVLFTSMCTAAGIKAQVVLVIRRDNGMNWMNLPSFDFDHAIAKAFLDGKEYYIELTSGNFPFATLNEELISAVVLDIDNDPEKVVPKFLNPITRQSNSTVRRSSVSFSGDDMTDYVTTIRTGCMAANSRSNYRDLGKDELEKKFTQNISGSYSNLKLQSLNFDSTLKSCSDTLKYNYSFIVPKVLTKINNLTIVKIPLTERMPYLNFLQDGRKYPIESWKYLFCDTLTEELIINFPENKTLAEVPKSVHYSCRQADYTLIFKVQGKRLIVVRKLVCNMNYVPVSDYPAYRSFMEAMISSDNQQIGFR
jgi:tetratricopeptide (TPR) repeat protein